ncbi:hypothetical protein [Nocardioides sp. NPDC006273]|uniref:hypothetical protein n=1 Tax=Nocardioides sp. NPDC006273 TaxID=3155598 RepID=UPI0033B4E40E
MRTVRSHVRTINGQRVHVTEHNRVGDTKKKAAKKGGRGGGGKGPKGRSLARRAWENTKKSFKAGRKKAKWAAFGFGALALVEITAFLSLNLLGFALVSIAVIAGATASVLVAVANAGGK